MKKEKISQLLNDLEMERQRLAKEGEDEPETYTLGKADGIDYAIKAILKAMGILDLRPDRIGERRKSDDYTKNHQNLG